LRQPVLNIHCIILANLVKVIRNTILRTNNTGAEIIYYFNIDLIHSTRLRIIDTRQKRNIIIFNTYAAIHTRQLSGITGIKTRVWIQRLDTEIFLIRISGITVLNSNLGSNLLIRLIHTLELVPNLIRNIYRLTVTGNKTLTTVITQIPVNTINTFSNISTQTQTITNNTTTHNTITRNQIPLNV